MLTLFLILLYFSNKIFSYEKPEDISGLILYEEEVLNIGDSYIYLVQVVVEKNAIIAEISINKGNSKPAY